MDRKGTIRIQGEEGLNRLIVYNVAYLLYG